MTEFKIIYVTKVSSGNLGLIYKLLKKYDPETG